MKKVLLIPFLLLLASCSEEESRDTFVLETSTGHTIKVVEPGAKVCIDNVVYIRYHNYMPKYNAVTSKVETCGIPK